MSRPPATAFGSRVCAACNTRIGETEYHVFEEDAKGVMHVRHVAPCPPQDGQPTPDMPEVDMRGAPRGRFAKLSRPA